MKQRSGGIFALIGLAVVFFVLREFFPSLAKLFLLLGGITVLGVAVLVMVVLFFAFSKPKKTAEQQAAENTAAVLQKGRSMLMDLRRLSMKVKDNEIRETAEAICAGIDKILRTLKEEPDDIGRVDRFFRYYLPTLQSVLTKYSRLEACGIPADDTVEKTRSCLKDMEKAMEKQYLNLFEDDKLDLSAEMTVMTQICKRDGLLADDYQIPEVAESPAAEESEGITLTM